MTLAAVIVEMGFGTGSSLGTLLVLDDAARGKLDTGTLGGGSEFTDVTDHVESWSCSRGISRLTGPILRYEAGHATIVLKDIDRRFDPDNLSGPYVSSGVTQVVPNVLLRIRALHNGVYYDVWSGYIDAWEANYVPGNRVTFVTVRATDGFKILGQNTLAAAGSTGASELTSARVTRILNAANWPASSRVIATGDSTVQATTLGANALALLQITADTEMGELYMDAAGRVYFRNRQGIMEDSRSTTSNVTFGDGGGSELPYQDVTPAYDDDQIVNQSTITRVGGVAQVNTLSAAASITANQTRTYERTDLIMETDSSALDLANTVVYQSKDPENRFDRIKLGRHQNNATEQLLFAQMLGRLIGDRVTVKRRPVGGGTKSLDVFIRGIEHSGSRMDWVTYFSLQSATKFAFLTLDDATLGKLDSNALAY